MAKTKKMKKLVTKKKPKMIMKKRKVKKVRKVIKKVKTRKKIAQKPRKKAAPKKVAKKKSKKAPVKMRPKQAKVEIAPAATPAPIVTSSPTLKAGDPAPNFRTLNDEGQEVSLSDLRGKKVVLYFYPKDDTPGCTKEACSFRDGISQIQARGATVLGVSVDDVDSHKRFKEKYSLNFPLLSDTDKKIVQDYGVWKEKNMYGRNFMGIERTTFLIDEAGRIAKIFPKVNVEEHYNEVLSALG